MEIYQTPNGKEQSIGMYQQPNDDVYIGFHVNKTTRKWYNIKDVKLLSTPSTK